MFRITATTSLNDAFSLASEVEFGTAISMGDGALLLEWDEEMDDLLDALPERTFALMTICDSALSRGIEPGESITAAPEMVERIKGHMRKGVAAAKKRKAKRKHQQASKAKGFA